MATIGSELACRSFVRVDSTPNFERIVEGQVYSWIKQKSWDAIDLTVDGPVEVANGVIGSLVRENNQDGSSNTRFRWVQSSPTGRWITELTYRLNRDRKSGWVWTDLHAPVGKQPQIPRLAKDLLTVLPAKDGSFPITDQPRTAHVEDVEMIRQALLDEDRRGVLYLAGTDEKIPLNDWAKYVGNVLKGTAGVASAYILDTEATKSLNSLLPASHQVSPWTVRTFNPNVDLEDSRDALKHRILSTGRIADDNPTFLRNLLARRAYALSVDQPLPHDVQRIDRRLRERLDDAVLSRTNTQDVVIEVEAPSSAEVAPSRGLLDVAKNIVVHVLGEDLSSRSLGRLGELAGKALRLESNDPTGPRARLRILEDELEREKTRSAEFRKLLDDSTLDHAETLERVRTAELNLQKLYGQLAKLQTTEIDYSPAEFTGIDVPPGDFDELIMRVDELKLISFTGDPAVTRKLDEQHDSYTWVWKTWDGLLALNDYANARKAGIFTSGGLKQYFDTPPAQCKSFPASKVAAVESDSVRSTPKYHDARIFAVPTKVDETGLAFMESHLKIAQAGMISPRVHFFDDTAKTGIVYVGHIGPHLPTQGSN